jgi:plasmid stability protein
MAKGDHGFRKKPKGSKNGGYARARVQIGFDVKMRNSISRHAKDNGRSFAAEVRELVGEALKAKEVPRTRHVLVGGHELPMASPFSNDHPSCQQPDACRRSTLASHLCQPCHFRKRRDESMPMTDDQEERAAQLLGERIGYGRMMQLGEKLWREKLATHTIGDLRGGEFSVGPCVAMLVPCPCPEKTAGKTEHCDWCCGSGRVTKRVLAAMTVPPANPRDAG